MDTTLAKCQRYYQLSHTNGQGYVNGYHEVLGFRPVIRHSIYNTGNSRSFSAIGISH